MTDGRRKLGLLGRKTNRAGLEVTNSAIPVHRTFAAPRYRNREQMVFRILEQDHELLSELLQDLQSVLQQQEAARAFELLDLFWARLAVHIRAENLCLFPMILNAPRELFRDRGGVPSFEEAKTMVESLRADHNFFMDELSRAMKTIRAILPDAESPHVAEQLDTIRERVDAVSLRLESHNALEEDQVYKWPRLILSASDLQGLRAALRRELENLPPRFAPQ